jgi:hypothetical protein
VEKEINHLTLKIAVPRMDTGDLNNLIQVKSGKAEIREQDRETLKVWAEVIMQDLNSGI